jgi:hypothetical protein
VDKDSNKGYNYGMLEAIMAGKNKPANANTAIKAKGIEDLTKKIAKLGFDKPYDPLKETV